MKITHTITTTFVFIIFLTSVFAVSFQVTALKPIPTLNSNIDIVWENNSVKPVIPREEVRQLNITVKYKVDWGRDLATGALDYYINKMGAQVIASLQITDHSSWCNPVLSLLFVFLPITKGETNASVKLTMQIKDDAPAYGDGFIKILAKVNNQGVVGGYEKEFTLDFTAGYLPRISADLTEGTTKSIGPTGSAVFPIKLNNLGNDRTTVFFNITNSLPKGWSAVISDSITLDENGDAMATLTVNPPRDFGYHDQRQSVIIKMTPARAADLKNIGESSYITVLVQSRGFYTPGFETISSIGAIAVVILGIALIRRKKK